MKFSHKRERKLVISWRKQVPQKRKTCFTRREKLLEHKKRDIGNGLSKIRTLSKSKMGLRFLSKENRQKRTEKKELLI